MLDAGREKAQGAEKSAQSAQKEQHHVPAAPAERGAEKQPVASYIAAAAIDQGKISASMEPAGKEADHNHVALAREEKKAAGARGAGQQQGKAEGKAAGAQAGGKGKGKDQTRGQQQAGKDSSPSSSSKSKGKGYGL